MVRIAKLNNIDGISHELQKIYRLARREQMPMEKAKGLTWILKTLSSMLVEHELEKRIAELEAKQL